MTQEIIDAHLPIISDQIRALVDQDVTAETRSVHDGTKEEQIPQVEEAKDESKKSDTQRKFIQAMLLDIYEDLAPLSSFNS